MSDARETGPPKRVTLLGTLSNDLSEVAAEVRRRGLRRQVRSTRDQIEAFYLDEESRRRLAGMGRIRRTFRRIAWLLRSLLLKLTPTRRVLLAIALVLLVTTFNVGDDEDLTLRFRLPGVGSVLVLLVLTLELKDKLIARSELVAGRTVQLALMPPESPAIPGWDVWLYTQPANDVGGDLVDHLRLPGGEHGLALGDVAGKALPAALLMVKLQATVRALAPDAPTLAALASAINRILHRDGLPNRFATLVYLVLGESSGRVRYVNAGHLPPLVLRGPSIEALTPGSMALGFVAEAAFEEHVVDLAPGDVLVAFSDGVVEATNAGDDFFGDDRLQAALGSCQGQPAADLGGAMLAAVNTFLGETKPNDDISIVVVRRR